ncbi:MAG: hypothetical protein HYV26_21915 [Candidatus Hydrogenedentes bacterium]|nr:hypothetical protein [Candidatus Hydrogenedentota bacterium]
MLHAILLIVFGASANEGTEVRPVLKTQSVLAPGTSDIKIGMSYDELLAARPNLVDEPEIRADGAGSTSEVVVIPEREEMKLRIGYSIASKQLQSVIMLWRANKTVMEKNRNMFFDLCWDNFGKSFLPEASLKKAPGPPVPFMFWDSGEIAVTASWQLGDEKHPDEGAFTVIIERAIQGKTVRETLGGKKADAETTKSVFGKFGLPLEMTNQGLRYSPEPETSK